MNTLSRTNPVVVPQSEIMKEARQDLSGKWGTGVIIYLVYIIFSSIAGIIPFGSFLIAGPLTLGLIIWAQKINREEHAEVGDLFNGFSNFGTTLLAYFLCLIAVLFGFVLLIIPGIILAIGLSMTFYIIEENPDITSVEAIKRSWEMMKGQKTNFFVLSLRFLPWAILCILTLGIGFLWLAPWSQVTFAKFYNYLAHGNSRGSNDEIAHASHLIDDF